MTNSPRIALEERYIYQEALFSCLKSDLGV